MRVKEFGIAAVVLVGLLALTQIPMGFAQQAITATTSQYLPIVFKALESPTASPTPTIAPSHTPTRTNTTQPTTTPSQTLTPTDIPPVQFPLINGGFEEGETGWVFVGAFVTDIVGAHSGARYALLGGDQARSETIAQRVTVPPHAPFLTFWHRNSSDWYSCSWDGAYVWVDPNPDDSVFSRKIVKGFFDFCQSEAHGYEQVRIDLSAYAGQTIELEFEMETTGGLYSFWSLDDIAFSN